MRTKGIFLVLAGLSACPGLNGQSVQCITAGDGCDAGAVHEEAVTNAIARFQNGLLYGGGSEPVVFSSALRTDGNALAMISYTCNDDSPPPRLEGSVIRSSFRKILSCPNRCGGVASSTNSNCGFGILISNNAANIGCFSKAINQAPQGTTTTTSSTTTTTGPATPTINAGTNGFTYYGCYSDSTSARVLSNQYIDASGMTIAACMVKAAGYNFAGVEYGQECWYGNTLSGSTGESSGCNMPCPGKETELCGGGNRLQLYKNPSYHPPNAPDTGSFTSEGCYTDSTESRGLDHTTTDPAMTIQKCLQLAAGFKYAGLQYHNECFWGNVLKSSSVPAGSSDCNAACVGDSSQICGGGNRLSLYINGDYHEPQAPGVNQGNDDWELVGCQSDSTSNRALENSQTDSAMTVEKCFELAFSFKYAAVQGGNTCYWGDELGSASQDENIVQCNAACAGKSDEVCGGSLKNILYVNNDFAEIDVEGMIALMEDLYENELAIQADLEEYESQRLQAEAEGAQQGGGNKHKRFIPALWVARLTATWVRVRARAERAMATNIRFQARMQWAWRRIGPYLQRFIANRPNAPQQFPMRALVPAQRHGAVVVRRGGEIMAIRPEQAAGGIVVALTIAHGIFEGIFDLVQVLDFHHDVEVYGPVEPTDPQPPDDPDDDPDDDPQDPENLKPCPCGINGCSINPGLKLARSEPMLPRPLEKRAAGASYKSEECPGLSYKVLNYPSYGELIGIYNQVNIVPPHFDVEFFTPPGHTQCFWRLSNYPAKSPKIPGTTTLATYATEHVFENNFMKGFFDRMVEVGCVPCATDATGPGIRELFYNPNNVAGSRYTGIPFKTFMVGAMSWYNDVYPNQGYLQDFFVLEEDINKNKYNILTGENIPNQWGAGSSLERFIEKIGRVQGVFQYMNRQEVANVFVGTFNRVFQEFTQFDNDVAYGQLHGPRSTPGSTCLAASDAPAGQGGWRYRFLHYMAAVLVDVEIKMAAWADNTITNLEDRRDVLWPPPVPPAQPAPARVQFDTWLTAQRQPGGQLHPNAYKFNRQLYSVFGLV